MKAQTPVRSCLSDDLFQVQYLHDEGFRLHRRDIEQHQQTVKFNPGYRRNQINIPVVVHVVYHTNEENISDSLIRSQIDILNNDFGSIQTNKYYQAGASSIHFELATSDPQGYKTNGITRTQTANSKFQTGTLIMSSKYGGVNPWPEKDYLNIWVGNLSGVLGFAYMPGSAGDGVVIGYSYFGKNTSAPFNLGRTTTHEVGHWLNLFHTWGMMTGCDDDDNVDDTPNSAGPNYGCNADHPSCSGIDMVENYMDYSDDACMNLFTVGQINRMESLFSPGGYRESILKSHGLDEGSTKRCNDGIQDGDETGIDCGGSCGICACMSKGSFSLFDYIESIKVNDTISVTGDNDGSFNQYAKVFSLYTNVLNPIVLSPGKAGNQSQEFWSIWIDWNKDGQYEQKELIYRNNSIGRLKDTLDLKTIFPSNGPSPTDTFKIRIQMRWGDYADGCDTFDFGEVENYSVTLMQAYIDPCNNGIQDGSETGVDCGPGCKPCALHYCDSKGKVSKYEFIQSVQLSGWNNNSGNNNGYGEFTSNPISVAPGEKLAYVLTAGFGGKYTLSENWYVWADWNQDGDFTDKDELLLDLNSTIPSTGQWDIPSNVSGPVRLRIQMKDSRKANACEEFGFGEVEDYMLLVEKANSRKAILKDSFFTINMYPNPVNNILHLSIHELQEEEVQVMLINVLGQIVYSKSLHLQQSMQTIDCSNILAGIYSIVLANKKILGTSRVIITH